MPMPLHCWHWLCVAMGVGHENGLGHHYQWSIKVASLSSSLSILLSISFSTSSNTSFFSLTKAMNLLQATTPLLSLAIKKVWQGTFHCHPHSGWPRFFNLKVKLLMMDDKDAVMQFWNDHFSLLIVTTSINFNPQWWLLRLKPQCQCHKHIGWVSVHPNSS